MVPRLFTVCLVGLGTVGKGVLLVYFKNKTSFRARTGIDIRICSSLRRASSKKATAISNHLQPASLFLDDPRLAGLVEVIGGTSDARRTVRRTELAKKLLITANKTLLSCYNFETIGSHSKLMYEAAVAGGIPLIRTIRQGLVGNLVSKIISVLNGTSNWMLSSACRYNIPPKRLAPEAIKKGYSEYDNSCDVDGADAVQKSNILITTTYNCLVRIRFASIEGIRYVKLTDILLSKKLGFSLKLVSVIKKHLGSISYSIQPSLVSFSHPLSIPSGTINAIQMSCNGAGRVWLLGRGAGSLPTSSSILSDVGTFEGFKQSFNQLTAKDLVHTTILIPSRVFYVRICCGIIASGPEILESVIDKGIILSFHRMELNIILVIRSTLRNFKEVLQHQFCCCCFCILS